MPDIVYVLTNPAMPKMVKIGRTDQALVDRVKQLSQSTSVPVPFEVFAAWEIEDAKGVEKALHAAFADHRVHPKREFFWLSPEKPTAVLKQFGVNDVTPVGDVVGENASEDQRALDETRARKSNFKFDMVGIEPGAVLTSIFDEEVTCAVHDKRKVVLKGEIMSLSGAALRVAHSKGKTWRTLAGPACWLYEGHSLSELRDEVDSDDSD